MSRGEEWGAAEQQRLAELWAWRGPDGERHTTAEIGKWLGRSKNAIVGRAHRLGLEARESPIKRPDGALPKPSRRPLPVIAATLPSLAAPVPPIQTGPLIVAAPIAATRPSTVMWSPAPPPVQPAPPPAVVFKPRAPGTCCWPMWSNKAAKPTHEYCGAPTVPGKSYCRAHCAKAWDRVPREVGRDAA